MAEDTYEATLVLAERLRALGHESAAALLEDRIRAGATGTEIQMGVRHALGRIETEAPGLPPDVIRECRRIAAAISVNLAAAGPGDVSRVTPPVVVIYKRPRAPDRR